MSDHMAGSAIIVFQKSLADWDWGQVYRLESAAKPWVENISQTVADEVEGEDEEEYGDAWRE